MSTISTASGSHTPVARHHLPWSCPSRPGHFFFATHCWVACPLSLGLAVPHWTPRPRPLVDHRRNDRNLGKRLYIAARSASRRFIPHPFTTSSAQNSLDQVDRLLLPIAMACPTPGLHRLAALNERDYLLKEFSNRDRAGAFGHRRITRSPTKTNWQYRPHVMAGALVTCLVLGFLAFQFQKQLSSIQLCNGPVRYTCIVDGDTGWEQGVKWRLHGVDTPELSSPGCSNEYRKAVAARDRLRKLMSSGYRIVRIGQNDRYGRELVQIVLVDGRNVGRVMLQEGLAQPWPNRGNIWCSR